jgi:hypothetical protein
MLLQCETCGERAAVSSKLLHVRHALFGLPDPLTLCVPCRFCAVGGGNEESRTDNSKHFQDSKHATTTPTEHVGPAQKAQWRPTKHGGTCKCIAFLLRRNCCSCCTLSSSISFTYMKAHETITIYIKAHETIRKSASQIASSMNIRASLSDRHSETPDI